MCRLCLPSLCTMVLYQITIWGWISDEVNMSLRETWEAEKSPCSLHWSTTQIYICVWITWLTTYHITIAVFLLLDGKQRERESESDEFSSSDKNKHRHQKYAWCQYSCVFTGSSITYCFHQCWGVERPRFRIRSDSSTSGNPSHGIWACRNSIENSENVLRSKRSSMRKYSLSLQ